MKLKIYIDIDNIFLNTNYHWLNDLNAQFNTSYEYSDITYWNWFPDKFGKNYDFPLKQPRFWDKVNYYPNAINAVNNLVAQGHDCYFVTSSYVNQNLEAKIHKVLERVNLTEQKVIIIHNKSLLRGDILIDDCIDQLIPFNGMRICMTQPWNCREKFSNIHYMFNWEDIEHYILKELI